ncbi:YolD-like family protein [Texcoconibacillus texcoconensis]|uniref:YolD-like family protein n=1 Tax=Texcoconibacillus texcoconensis TaxID=1095777 RepID=A0A840QU28_9BACI|nr:YolD-like family protein [Texcoconibacillus texcoconensis]MBB5174874.1 hypothetical protein [Texcoconibacillus texcoconensis]
MSKYQDRGLLKWQGMMLPEHVQRLNEWETEKKKATKPMVDEQQFIEMEYTIAQSIAENKPVHVTYWEDGSFYALTGHIRTMSYETKHLKVVDQYENVVTIHVQCIVDISISP